MPKRILFICTNLSLGGAQTILYNLIAKLDRRVYQPEVLSLMGNTAYSQKFEAINVKTHQLSMQRGLIKLKDIRIFRNIVKSISPSIIQGWMYHGNLAASYAGYMLKVPYIWGIHHSLDSLSEEKFSTRILIRISAYLSSKADSIVYVSETSLAQHTSAGYSKPNSLVIPNGFDTELFIPNSNTDEIKRKLNISENSKVIGMLARYHPVKDHKTMLEAAAIVVKDIPQTVFILCGSNIDTNNTQLTDIIKNLNLCGRVFLLGAREDIPKIISAFDILTLTSVSEAFPMVLGEAMSAGIPCVSTDVGDSRQIIGDCGLVVPRRNPEKLAEAWQSILRLERHDYKRLSKHSRRRIIELYSMKNTVKKYENLYLEQQINNQS